MSTEIALKDQNYNLVSFGDDFKESFLEEMDGLGTITFDVVKIPSGGSLAFELPGENEDEPITSGEIKGIIVDQHAVNALWMDAFDGANNPPDCSSFDGKVGQTAGGELRDCANCPYNQFGSGKDGKGKACKNMRRLYIQLSDSPLPIMLTLPPSSLASFKNYLSKSILLKGKKPYQVMTKVTLKKEKSSGGITYSQAVFSKVGDLSAEDVAAAKSISDGIKAVTRSSTMRSAEALKDISDDNPFED